MSIRTKLLAATVGLNGAILILALYLFIQSEKGTGIPYQARAELMRISALEAEGIEASKDAVQRIVLQQSRSAVWKHVYVVLNTSGATKNTVEIWAAADFYATPKRGPQLADDDQLERVRRDYQDMRNIGYVYSDDATAVVAVEPGHKFAENPRQSYAILAYPKEVATGARTLYLFMIGGVIVLTAVLFLLVSKLVVHPLRDLASAAEQIAGGDYNVQLQPRGGADELARTIGAFNRMAREIAEYQGHLEDRVLSALTRIKKAEQHLVIAQRLAATGKLAAGLAHEINNPLGGMKNAVRSLARGDLPPEKTDQYLDLINDGLGRVEQTVKQFLTFTPRKVEPKHADLVAVAQKALALAEHRIARREITLSTQFPEDARATVYGDAHELQQVTLNLLLNAADAIPENRGGHIELAVRADGDEVVLSVADDGSGMSPEDQDRCFDMFFTTKVVGEGTGLGLAVVHNIVTNHGGRIEVQSTLGEGSVFRIHLPLDAPAAEPVLPQPEPREVG